MAWVAPTACRLSPGRPPSRVVFVQALGHDIGACQCDSKQSQTRLDKRKAGMLKAPRILTIKLAGMAAPP